MASGPRVVAERGRPETPDETAARKAASSRAYRSSQTFRNLIAALIATVAVVAVVYLGVPRGTPPEHEPADVPSAAAAVEASLGRTVLVPDLPADWRANSARVENGAWRVVYAPATGFVTVAQGLDAAADWPASVLGPYAPTGTTTVEGLTWDVYEIPGDGAVGYALATPAGRDTVLIYGSMTAETAETAAASVTDQIQSLRKDAP
jgi:hypothetical protein